jgi:DNA-binding transcriptional LysR family regulator
LIPNREKDPCGNNYRSVVELLRAADERQAVDKLRAITFFCRTVESKSFTAAAQALTIVPSALSKALSALEEELGFRLLNRSTRRLSLTHEGEVYYEQCRALLQGLEDAENAARDGNVRARGTLRIGLHPALRVAVLGALGPFLEQHPNITIETVVTNSPAAVVDEGLDVVVRIGELADSGLLAKPLGRVRSIVCAAPAYLASAGEPQHPGDLARHRAIIYGRRDEASNAEWTFFRKTERVKVLVPVRVVMRDGIGVTDAAVGGCGVALPIDISVRHLLRSGALRALLPDWAGEQYPLYAVTAPGRGRTPAKVQALLEFVKSCLDQD